LVENPHGASSTRSIVTKRGFTHFVSIFFLLFAQQGAFVHAAWHARQQAPVQHQDQGKASFQGDLCGLHGAFSQVLGGVQPTAVHHSVPQRIDKAIAHRPGACVVLELHVPHSRGPPLLS
jgi:hypothetical protein